MRRAIVKQLFASRRTATAQQQLHNKHFLIVQWPSNEVTIRIDESRSVKERQELMNDIITYAESQSQRILNLQPVESKKQHLDFVAQQSRQIDSMLNDKDSDKSAFHDPLQRQESNTLSCQLNSVALIDRMPFDDSNMKIQQAVLKAQQVEKSSLVQKRTKRDANNNKRNNKNNSVKEDQQEEEHPTIAVKPQ